MITRNGLFRYLNNLLGTRLARQEVPRLCWEENFFIAFALKVAGYLRLARDLVRFASREFEEIFDFHDLFSLRTPSQFQSLVEN